MSPNTLLNVEEVEGVCHPAVEEASYRQAVEEACRGPVVEEDGYLGKEVEEALMKVLVLQDERLVGAVDCLVEEVLQDELLMVEEACFLLEVEEDDEQLKEVEEASSSREVEEACRVQEAQEVQAGHRQEEVEDPLGQGQVAWLLHGSGEVHAEKEKEVQELVQELQNLQQLLLPYP